jgi:hypothetical protein
MLLGYKPLACIISSTDHQINSSDRELMAFWFSWGPDDRHRDRRLALVHSEPIGLLIGAPSYRAALVICALQGSSSPARSASKPPICHEKEGTALGACLASTRWPLHPCSHRGGDFCHKGVRKSKNSKVLTLLGISRWLPTRLTRR